ncbi:MAG: glucosamine-6-phosphate deaminase, partial [Eubacteriales bacterium]|nr:glucosamine-6-phosphate deaminase [Eubacteriales bacterium]
KALLGEVTPQIPASILRMHENVYAIYSKEKI